MKASLLGRLISMGKFCLLAEDGIHYSDGISHAGYLEGKTDPSVSVDFQERNQRRYGLIRVNARRELTSLLQFIEQDSPGDMKPVSLAFL
nr:hypothetical protein [Klebsiella pneumoniae subsp. pneumoniae]